MAMELTYVTLRPLRIGGQVRPPGALAPEAVNWHNIDAYIRNGSIAPVPREQVDQDELRAAEEALKPQVQEKPQDEPEAVNEVDDLEQYHSGSGWYEVPGAEKKMRRDEAEAFLAEGEEE